MSKINYKFFDPEYIDKPNHLVIGAGHLCKVPESKIPDFIERFNPLSGMKIESIPSLPSDIPYDCVEVLAKVAMAGKPFEYIATERPDGTQLGEIIGEYDLPLELVEICHSFVPLFHSDMKPLNSVEDISSGVLHHLNYEKKRYPSLDVDRAIINHGKILQNLISTNELSLQDITTFSNMYLLYHGHIIEYEFMQPDILDFRERIDGKIGVIVGLFHADRIDDMLEGNLREKPISWMDYRRFLPPNISRIFESIEELVLENED